MRLNMKQYSCGGCGGTAFELYTNSDETFPEGIIVECKSCGSTSEINIAKPTMEVSFGDDNSKGCICFL